MSAKIRTVSYFYMCVPDKPGEGCRVLAELAEAGVNLLAFSAVPVGPESTQLVLFPDSVDTLLRVAERGGYVLTGPHRAFLIQGDDRLGALVETHEKLCDAGINVYASTGVSDGRGGFGYVMYVRGEQFEEASGVLGV